MKVPAEHSDCLKYCFDGCSTLLELAESLENVAAAYRELAAKDARLQHPVDGSRVNYIVPGHDIELELDEDGEPYDDQWLDCPQCYEVS
jgi:hypothetical protein